MTESNNPPPPPSGDPYDTVPPSAPPPPPDAAMLNPNAPPATPAQPVGYASGSYGYPGPYQGPEPDQNAKTWGMLAHISSLSGLIIPFGNLIGPLVVWQMKKNEHPFIDDQGKESVNFQILMAIALIVSGLLICVFIGFFILPVVLLLQLIFEIIAGVKANNGEPYRYPFNIRFIK